MNLTDQQIDQIAEDLDSGMLCFVHKETSEVESFTSEDDPLFDKEAWQEIIDKVKNNREDYLEFSPMDSHEAFEVMENFALSLNDEKQKSKLIKILDRPKPFANFKSEVEESDFKKDWDEFEKKANVKWVEKQIEYYDRL
jgi:spore coat polysaccharide biosynthesis protein SpsF (cytidylyltransferase family)